MLVFATLLHPIIPGIFFLHGDSLEKTFDNYHEKLATYLKVESGYEHNYIMTNDGEQALKNSKEKFFPEGIHLQCEEHLKGNLADHCTYRKNSKKHQQVISFVMTQMAGCESLETFDELVDNVPEDAFKGNFFEDFAKKLRKNVEARLKAPRVIPKYVKTNYIESSNGRCKVYTEHTPRTIPDVAVLLKQMVANTKDYMIQAGYGEGPWAIAPGSRLKRISKAAWKLKSKKPKRDTS